ncbi:hypothetical protein [Citrobacter sp. MNAZ 1397]|uniref:hypothetical protein n=1 Tax=Citrobacter sp. MNAZ 1397 TaxID=2911205 RepID=UPI00202764D9|nr:hypothetical protein [Citrobacter sp. MNAZ 1397]MCL9674535.1 hypothetical protein [Citrobacter sp. MNAZ 1397]
MTAHAAEFFTLDEVNRLKIIQDVVDRHLTTQRLGIHQFMMSIFLNFNELVMFIVLIEFHASLIFMNAGAFHKCAGCMITESVREENQREGRCCLKREK